MEDKLKNLIEADRLKISLKAIKIFCRGGIEACIKFDSSWAQGAKEALGKVLNQLETIEEGEICSQSLDLSEIGEPSVSDSPGTSSDLDDSQGS